MKILANELFDLLKNGRYIKESDTTIDHQYTIRQYEITDCIIYINDDRVETIDTYIDKFGERTNFESRFGVIAFSDDTDEIDVKIYVDVERLKLLWNEPNK